MTKALMKLVVKETYLDILTVTYEKLIADTKLNGEKQKSFPLKSGMRQ
jgi:hypothetical protein